MRKTVNQFISLIAQPSRKLSLEDQQRAVLLSLSILSFVLIGTFAQTLFAIQAVQDKFDLISGYLFSIFILTPSYILSRTRHYKLGAISFGLVINLAILGSIITNGEDISYLYYLLLPVFLFSLFLTFKITLTLACASLFSCLVLYANQTDPSIQSDLLSAGVFITISSAFILSASKYRNWLEQTNRQALMERETQYRNLLSTAYESIAFIENGYIIEANSLFINLFGYSQNELNGQIISDLIPKINISELEDILAKTGTSKNVVEVEGVHKRGTTLNLELLAHKHLYQKKSMIALSIRDITHRRETEEAILQAQRLDSLGVLTGGIAHDFNNMLTGIMGQASVADMKIEEDHVAKRHVKSIIKTSDRASDLTQQLLAYAGKRVTSAQMVDVNALIDDNKGLFDAALVKSINVVYELEQGLPLIHADRGQLQQVLMNLVINAGDACSQKGGQITVSTFIEQVTEQNKIHSVTNTTPMLGTYVCLRVRDTGSGIEPEIVERIFEPFYSTKEYGRGLGLAATLGVIKSHSGYLSMATRVGEGTTFEVYFPAMSETSETITPYAPSVQTHFADNTILIIDDEEDVLDVVRDGLAINGFNIITASDGVKGTAIYSEQKELIDLVILDIQMPIMNGVEVLHYIKKINPQVRVIISSGYSDINLSQLMTSYDYVSHFPKPYTVNKLTDAINDALNVPSL